MNQKSNPTFDKNNNLAAGILLINKEGKILAVSRKSNHDDMGTPAGKVEPGETLKEAAIRETFEETSIKIEECFELYTDMARTRMTTIFYATKWSGEPTSSEEGIVRWVDPDELYKGTYGFYNRKMMARFFSLANEIIINQTNQ